MKQARPPVHKGIALARVEQAEPRGIAEALPVGESFASGNGCVLIHGDNIFWGHMDFLRDAVGRPRGAAIFGYPVTDPERYGGGATRRRRSGGHRSPIPQPRARCLLGGGPR